jgi:CRISPR-associated protein Cas2
MTRTDVRRILIAYDVPDDRRRLRLAKALSSYGDRVQYSVFVVDAAPVRVARLKRAVEKLIVAGEDSVLFCDLGPVEIAVRHRFLYLGKQRPITDAQSFII